jgi:lipopolysaccharide export system protein LptA
VSVLPARLLIAALVLAAGAAGASAQNFGLGLSTQDSGKPISIEAENGIEWQQNNRVYIARGNAKATRGNATLYGDTLMAFYRPVCSPEARAAAAKRAAAAAAAPAPANGQPPPPRKPERVCPDTPAQGPAPPAQKNGDPVGGNSTEIYRVEAEGNVRIATETQTVYGGHAIYDVDSATLVVTGKNLKLETQRDVVTARDSLEWYDDRQLAVARGDAVEVREGKRLRGDVLVGEVEKDASGNSRIQRIDARGNVLVSSLDQIARSDTGVYNLDTGIATLAGRVTITRGDNEMRGRYGVVDLNKNIGRLLSEPPDQSLTSGGPAPRVSGILKRSQPTQDASDSKPPQKGPGK